MSAAQKTSRETYDALIADSLRKNLDWSRIAIFERSEPLAVISEALQGRSQHILQSAHPHFVQDLNVSARMIHDHNALVHLPMTTILSPSSGGSAREKELLYYGTDFREAGQKSEVLSQIDSALSQRAVSDSIRSDVLLIADELFTNAIFNAPFVDPENTSTGAPRDSVDLQMPGNKAGHLVLGGDAQRIVIGCRDDYGTLNFSKLLSRIKNCYEQGVAATMRMSGRSGAGIGSFMIFNSAASIFFDVKMFSHTAVFCTLPTKMSSRARMEIPKNLHFRVQNY